MINYADRSDQVHPIPTVRSAGHRPSDRRRTAAGRFASDNVDRIRYESAFAKLCGVAPQPGNSGRTTAGTSSAAAETAPRTARSTSSRSSACDAINPPDIYVERRTAEGLSKPEIIRCLKRYIAREIYNHLPTSATNTQPPTLLTAAA